MEEVKFGRAEPFYMFSFIWNLIILKITSYLKILPSCGEYESTFFSSNRRVYLMPFIVSRSITYRRHSLILGWGYSWVKDILEYTH